MSMERKMEWALLALTSILLIALKWLHWGVIHYNIFVLILMGWSLILILAFRALHSGQEERQDG